jgi:PAS domain S-box-containing protein
MTHRRNMAQTMMIDFPPELAAKPKTPAARSGKRRFVVRRPGQSSTVLQTKKPAEERPLALSNELISFFEGIYDAAILTDMQGQIIDANVRAVQFFGFMREDFKRSAIGDIISGIRGEILETINNNLTNNQFTLLQTECVRNDGSHFPAEISTSLIPLLNKQCLCFFIRDVTVRREAEKALKQAHDDLTRQVEERTHSNQVLKQEIAERKRIESELTSAIAKLQHHDEARSEFISNVSHEFRTPLTSIKYVADNMLRGVAGEVSEKGMDYLSMILADCDRLARTVEDILDLSRMDANSLKMHWVRAPIGRLVQRTVDSLRVQAEKQGLTMRCTISQDALFVTCDVQKMERVILNVVKNAIKFTPEGGHIDVQVKLFELGARTVNVMVCDDGPGIPPEHIGRVTERYYRVGEYVSGTGLGLAICKELIAFHNGLLDLQSPVPGIGCGTQVAITLPAATAPTVCLVNETEAVAYALSGELGAHGFSLHRGCLADGGMNDKPSDRPSVIVLDWTAPGLNAAVALAHIQASPEYGSMPMLVLVGDNPDPARDEVLQGLGVTVLRSPWHPGDMINLLEGMIPDDPVNAKHEG